MAKKASTSANTTTWLNDKKGIISPIGTALWANINKPDERYGAKFKISLIVDPDSAEIKTFISNLKSIVKSSGHSPDLVDNLIKVVEDKKGNENTILTFTTKAFIDDKTGQYRTPKVFNSKNQAIPPMVWGGDTIRVGFKLAHWKSSLGQGIKMYLDSVQLLKKGANSGGQMSLFDIDDSYDPIEFPDTTSGSSSSVNIDSLPDNDDDNEDIL